MFVLAQHDEVFVAPMGDVGVLKELQAHPVGHSGNLAGVDTEGLVAFVASELEGLADPERAAQMAAYMKTDMPFYGVTSPERKLVFREARNLFPVETPDDYEAAILALWSQPQREAKYVGLGYATEHRKQIGVEWMGLYEKLIVEGAWWDFVDDVAVHAVGRALLGQRSEVTPIVRSWIDSEDMWLRRTAIICQVRHKSETDEALLFDHALACLHEKEFFIRKAIGWALRDYSWFEPEVVRSFLLEHKHEMSGLTYREGAKRIPDMPPYK